MGISWNIANYMGYSQWKYGTESAGRGMGNMMGISPINEIQQGNSYNDENINSNMMDDPSLAAVRCNHLRQ